MKMIFRQIVRGNIDENKTKVVDRTVDMNEITSVYHIEGDKNTSQLFLKNGQRITVNHSLEQIEKLLNAKGGICERYQ